MARGKKEFYYPGGGAHCPVLQGSGGTPVVTLQGGCVAGVSAGCGVQYEFNNTLHLSPGTKSFHRKK